MTMSHLTNFLVWLDTHGKDQSNSKPKCAENLEDSASNKESQVEPTDDGCSSSHRGEYFLFNHFFNLENLTSYLVGVCSLIIVDIVRTHK